MSGAIGCTLRLEIKMTDTSYPIWAIKRRDDEVESPENKNGYPGYDHAIWYWWKLDSGGNRYNSLTFDSCLDRIEFHNQSSYRDAKEHSGTKIVWERLSTNTWRVLRKTYGNIVVLATLVRLDRIKNPESTYRWYRE